MSNFFRLIIIVSTLVFILEACGQTANKEKMIYLLEDFDEFPYDIYNPTEKFVLKDALREISGLTYYNANSLLCINDEKGIVYKYHLNKKEVTKKYHFEKSGDYEGLEMVDSLVYVLRSDGKVFKINNLRGKNTNTIKRSTILNAGNDTEGLGYDASSNSLLIACKGNPARGNKYLGKRVIYKYSLDKNELIDTPYLFIDQGQIRKILEFNGYARFSVKLFENLNPAEGDITFQPSAVAVHPITNNIYVLGSVGKLLLVLNSEGEIQAVVKLKRKIFRQPEGICFAPDGTMFISNEGKGSKANILQFKFNK